MEQQDCNHLSSSKSRVNMPLHNKSPRSIRKEECNKTESRVGVPIIPTSYSILPTKSAFPDGHHHCLGYYCHHPMYYLGSLLSPAVPNMEGRIYGSRPIQRAKFAGSAQPVTVTSRPWSHASTALL